MSEYTLLTRSPLNGFEATFGHTTLCEVSGRSLVTLAIPLDGRVGLEQALWARWELEIPQVGYSACTMNNNIRLLALQTDQLLVMLSQDDDQAAATLAADLGPVAYYTDQSDNWVMLRISGEEGREALERICPLDLHPDVFVEGAVSRTAMEHMGVMILREADHSFLLMTMRSLATSLLHALETSLKNIV